jgi:hypothetical protein
VKRLLPLLAVLLVAIGLEAGPAHAARQAPRCLDPAGWQKLANRIHAPVYCPGYLPDPLDGKIGGRWNNIHETSRDRSYLESFVWQETGPGAAGGELHVNLRGYPGRTAIPRCTTVNTVEGVTHRGLTPCFASPRGSYSANGIKATMYTVNQDADQWHVAFVWRRGGSLYTLSEHVAPPLTFAKVVDLLKRQLRSLVLVRPR